MGKPELEEEFFGPKEAQQFAEDAGYSVVGEPKPEKKHFRLAAEKGGVPIEIDVHRDGSIVDHSDFAAAAAKMIAEGRGYTVVGEPVAEKKHFEMIGKKDGQYFSFDAHRDGDLKKLRTIDPSDPRLRNLAS